MAGYRHLKITNGWVQVFLERSFRDAIHYRRWKKIIFASGRAHETNILRGPPPLCGLIACVSKYEIGLGLGHVCVFLERILRMGRIRETALRWDISRIVSLVMENVMLECEEEDYFRLRLLFCSNLLLCRSTILG